jgi:adenylate cyclase class IV
VEGVRDPSTGKVKQRVIRHIGSAESKVDVDELVKLGEFIKLEIDNKIQSNLFTPEAIVEMVLKSKQQGNDTTKDFAVDDVRNLRQEQRNIIGIHDIYGRIF